VGVRYRFTLRCKRGTAGEGYVIAELDGTPYAEVAGLTGGATTTVDAVAFGISQVDGAAGTAGAIEMGEATVDSDPSANPYAPDTVYNDTVTGAISLTGSVTESYQVTTVADPTEGEMVSPRNLVANVRIQKTPGTGLRIMTKAGAGEAPPSGPTDVTWLFVADIPEDEATFRDVAVALPTNDDDYTVAAYAFTGAVFSASPTTFDVFGAPPPLMGPLGTDWVSMRVTTTRAGFPRIETATEAGFASPTVYDALDDGVTDWRLVPASSLPDMANPAVGVALDVAGWPAASDGDYVRREIPATSDAYFARSKARSLS
jgi:hypothetical protein